ncbi:MAG: LysE family transporter, partial [Candidatus Rokubacteria bacterium]|nr:LysE family transporter [Candidatus Rokubacteria bacterium]
VRAFFGRSSVLSVPAGAAPPASRWRIFVNGVVLQAANPKALLFFSAILPQFIDPQRSVVAQIAILGVTSVVLEFFVLLAYGTLAARAGVIALRPRFSTLANRVAGSLLVAAGVGLARARRA